MMTEITLTDAVARQHAVDPRRSCIVRAPAGSGKTELLIQRYLALLAIVERPDEILAITFTRKAAAEMAQRVVAALQQAQQPLAVDAGKHEQVTWQLAQAVLQRDQKCNWHLLQHRGQLQIKTIDSFNSTLVQGMPWLSRLGGLPQIVERAEPLYRDAVRQIIHLHHNDGVVNTAVQTLLIHLDNRGDILEQMLIKMLAQRDQWLRHLLCVNQSAGDGADVNGADGQRQQLEQALAAVVASQLQQLLATLDGQLQQELLVLGQFAAQHCAKPDKGLVVLAQMERFPEAVAADLPLWRGLADLLLTADGSWRKRYDKNCGFPAGKKQPYAGMKQRITQLSATLRETGHSNELWQRVAMLPDPHYSAQQWQVLQALITVLPCLVAQLWLVSSRTGQVDFSEIALKARQALIDSGNPSDQLLLLDQRVQHILLDEFQDTSWLQFDLLQTLTSGWQQGGDAVAGDGRSLFIVGDPMQSIYRFREAEVGLFLQASASGVASVALESLQLSANFRSQQGLVEWVNCWFPTIFPRHENIAAGAVCYSQAQAVLPPLEGSAVQVFPQVSLDVEDEAQQVCAVVENILRHTSHTVAILVRSRGHLVSILTTLRAAGIPYQAQNVDPLAQRLAVADIVALTKALLHPADNLNWLSVLRAPWCGVRLADLIHFKGEAGVSVLTMIGDAQRLAQLSEDGRLRIQAVLPVLTAAVTQCGRCTLRQLVEGAWHALGGEYCYSETACQDVEQVLGLLEKLDHGGGLLNFELLDDELNSLFAASDVLADGRLQVMTIHRAKGLEFDHVVLPGLGRTSRGVEKTLLRWQEHTQHGLLLAPIAARGDGVTDPIYDLLGQLEQQKGDNEIARLLYVAVTRAKRNLYLFGHANHNKDEQSIPAKGSLLEKLWPAVADHFNVLEPATEVNVATTEQVALWRLTTEFLTTNYARDCNACVANKHSDGHGTLAPLPDKLPALVGTVTHGWLEYLSNNNDGCWQAEELEELRYNIVGQLSHLGITATDSAGQALHILAMLRRTVTSDRGRWILAAHEDAHCEYSLSGMVDGMSGQGGRESQLLNVIIDRTFIDDGIRWIIDYKTTAPGGQQDLQQFYDQQSEQYREQLTTYAHLLFRLDPVHQCRCGLYFPAFDGWCEVDMAMNQSELQPELDNGVQGELF